MKKWSWLAVVIVGVMLLFSGVAVAKVIGPCVNCHTMHYSQTPWPSQWGSGGPYKALVVNSCAGCHSADGPGVIRQIGSTKVPVVWCTSTAPTYDTSGTVAGTGGGCLAGGNFYWVSKGSDEDGHNVAGIANEDGDLGLAPPGYRQLPDDPAKGLPANAAGWTTQLTCGGTYGCHGDHDNDANNDGVTSSFEAVYGAHHADDSCVKYGTYSNADAGSTVGKSYRFLFGIKGVEDDDWENTVSPSDHNLYKGADRTSDTAYVADTISFLCAECHGDFHSGADNAGMDNPDTLAHPWIRHPTDYDMGNLSGTEYSHYGHPGQSEGTYSPIAPVGMVSITDNIASAPSTVNFNDDTVVLCVSCHRAHGTPGNGTPSDHTGDILRWNYDEMNAGSSDDPRNNIGGCFICHTTK